MPANILVIEDDAALVELLEYNLVAAGFAVATAQSAEEGPRHVHRQPLPADRAQVVERHLEVDKR